MTITTSLSAALVVATACAAGGHGTEPGDMTAAEHMAAAREHSEQAIRSRDHYYPGPYYGSPWGRGYGSYPWYYSWDPAEEHRALAAAHRDAAEQLKLEYEVACALIPRGLEARSPLELATSVSPSDRGVVFHLSEQAGSPEVVLTQIRCHRAWLQLAPTATAADNPVLVEGVTWMTHAGAAGVDVVATARTDAARTELSRRAALVIEHANKPSAMR